MKGYDLDEKSGLFGMFGVKSPAKIIKSNDTIDLKHSSLSDFVKATVMEAGESSVKIKSKDAIADPKFFKGDHVVLHFTSGDLYVLSGEIDNVHSASPLEATIKISKIEKMKDAKKSEKLPVCLYTTLKVIGIQDSIPAVAKNISFSGVKINCKEDIMLEDFIDVSVSLDKANKFLFKGRVVRRNSLSNCTEYGIEVYEIGESSVKNLTRYINQ
jgi:hypothetical protein